MRATEALRTAIAGGVAVGALAAAAAVADAPLVFPSLGPTAYLVFGAPRSAASAPRSVVLGHAVGLLAGQAALQLTGLAGAPSTLEIGVDAPRVVAVALAIAGTAAGTAAARAWHPPAGATTLIVALGLLQGPAQVAWMFAAVVAFTALSAAMARLVGLPLPLWAPAGPDAGSD